MKYRYDWAGVRRWLRAHRTADHTLRPHPPIKANRKRIHRRRK